MKNDKNRRSQQQHQPSSRAAANDVTNDVTKGTSCARIATASFVILLFGLHSFGVEANDQPFKPDPLRAGPWKQMTRGEVWPKPKKQEKYATFLALDPNQFSIKPSRNVEGCPIFEASERRFLEKRIFVGETLHERKKRMVPNVSDKVRQMQEFRGFLSELELDMLQLSGCESLPHPDMDESYELLVDIGKKLKKRSVLRANSIWGILRGLETFSQLVYNTKELGYIYVINSTYIEDEPRFKHRSVMLDTSRHYLSKKVILDQLDLMEMNKINIFHWHLTDDTSFPYVSQTFPNLSKYGAYDPVTHVYDPVDVQEIIDAARIRGIRVIPEFDTPGHAKSWELGQPGLLVQCENERGEPKEGVYGAMDPTKVSTYDFLHKFFEEIVHVFPDPVLHVGGDETLLGSCWSENKQIAETLRSWDMAGRFDTLEEIYLANFLKIFKSLKVQKRHIVWQEVFDNHFPIDKNNTIVNVWKNWGTGWKRTLMEAATSGHYVVLSAPWYLNYFKYGSDWVEFYKVDPLSPFTAGVGQGHNDESRKRVLGGEICLWGEFVNSINAISRLWPRASAPAEVLWSHNKDDLQTAAARLQEHECRMLARGYPVQPAVGAGFCPVHWGF